MKKRLNKTLADVEKTIEFTSALPEDTLLKVNVKNELIKRLQVIVKNLNDLDDFLEMLEKTDASTLLSTGASTLRQCSAQALRHGSVQALLSTGADIKKILNRQENKKQQPSA